MVGLNRSYRNKMVFSSSEPASRSKPKTHNLIAGSSDPLGGIDEETAEELRYEDCISDNESYDSNHVMDIEPTNVLLRSLCEGVPTTVFQIVTCHMIVPFHSTADYYPPLLAVEHLP